MITSRTTGEIVLLMLTSTVALLLLIAGLGVTVFELVHPGRAELTGVVASLFDVMKVIIGAVLGYAAGRIGPAQGARHEGTLT
jgi:hypothetical protein